jgi:hypothetical protein
MKNLILYSSEKVLWVHTSAFSYQAYIAATLGTGKSTFKVRLFSYIDYQKTFLKVGYQETRFTKFQYIFANTYKNSSKIDREEITKKFPSGSL